MPLAGICQKGLAGGGGMSAGRKGGSLLLAVNSCSPDLALWSRVCCSAACTQGGGGEPWTTRAELDPAVSVSVGSHVKDECLSLHCP